MMIPTRGTKMTSSIADVLFSGAQQRVLGLLFGQPDRSKCAFIFGSVAKQVDTADSDIDGMVIANGLAYSDL